MGATLRTTEDDLNTLRSAVKQAGQSVMLPSYARDALAASLRLIESHEKDLKAAEEAFRRLRDEVERLRSGLPACGLKPGAI